MSVLNNRIKRSGHKQVYDIFNNRVISVVPCCVQIEMFSYLVIIGTGERLEGDEKE